MSIAVGILADAHNLFVAERVRGIPHRCMKIVARQAGIGFEQVPSVARSASLRSNSSTGMRVSADDRRPDVKVRKAMTGVGNAAGSFGRSIKARECLQVNSRLNRVRHLSVGTRKTGAPGRARTCDPRLRRPVLYPTELRAPTIWAARQQQHTRIRAG